MQVKKEEVQLISDYYICVKKKISCHESHLFYNQGVNFRRLDRRI